MQLKSLKAHPKAFHQTWKLFYFNSLLQRVSIINEFNLVRAQVNIPTLQQRKIKKKSVQNPLTSLGHFLVYYIKTTHLNPQFMTQRVCVIFIPKSQSCQMNAL